MIEVNLLPGGKKKQSSNFKGLRTFVLPDFGAIFFEALPGLTYTLLGSFLGAGVIYFWSDITRILSSVWGSVVSAPGFYFSGLIGLLVGFIVGFLVRDKLYF